MATQRDFYDILGVPRGASDDDIKRSFRRLAQQWHPDVNTSSEADARFKEINEAYQVLSDPQRRQAYDMFGRAGVGGGGFDPFGGAAGQGFSGFGDIFDAFFGGATGGARRPRVPTGADLRYDLELTFAESISGTEKEIEFTSLARCETCGGTGAEPGTSPTTCPKCNGTGELRQVRSTMLGQMINVTACDRCRGTGKIVETPCHTCRGDGRVERKRSLRVTIPAGIAEGHQIRLSGEGEAAPRGGVPGNLYVVVHVTPHPQLTRQDTELFYELPLSITQAALGARVTVPTATGEEEIEIKPGTQPGAEIRLRGRGVPHLRRPDSRGDLHVLVDVKVPQRLTARQRELLEQLSAELGEVEEAADFDSSAGTDFGRRCQATQVRPAPRARARAARPTPGRDQLIKNEGVSAAGSWYELAVEADQEAVEQVSEILIRACPGGVSVEAPFVPVQEGLAARIDPARPAIVRGYISAIDAGAVLAAVDAVRTALGHLQAFELRPIGELHTRVVHEEDWAEAWKEHFPVLRVGRRLVIRPTWREHEAAPDDVVLSLDPGMAFGTGLHPTTRLCLTGIERWSDSALLSDARVLDVGTGSGILAIAAALLGASHVLGVDIDPLAVETTRANAAANGMADFIGARTGGLPLAQPAQFHLVVANLISGLLIDLATELAATLWPGGRLLAGGIYRDREPEVQSAFESAGLRMVGRMTEEDWVALELEAASS